MGAFFMTYLSGCSSIYYLYQAGRGQLRLFNRARPIKQVIADPTTPPELAEILRKIPEIKAFGEQSGLRPTQNYQDYVKLDQDAVVYVVTVADALQFKPKIFSFPVVGSFNYIGWFGLEDAKKFASGFEREGFDVDVRGASAYSTLGWFKDPLLSTMISRDHDKLSPEAYPEMVNVFLHESVHATVYISNQSYFNESLAVFVADKLTAQYFESKHQENSLGYQRYLEAQNRYEKVRMRLNTLYLELKKVYDSSVSAEEKQTLKRAKMGAIEDELQFKRKLTNATLIQYETYHSSEDDFKTLYESTGRSVPIFMKIMANIRAKDFTGPQQENLKSLIERLRPVLRD